jgi:hypothetical protein
MRGTINDTKSPINCGSHCCLLLGAVSESMAQKNSPVPQWCGTLREIWPNGPRVLSYLPEMGPGDEQAIMVPVPNLHRPGLHLTWPAIQMVILRYTGDEWMEKH